MDNKIDVQKYINKINKKNETESNSGIKKYLVNFLLRSLICLVLFLTLAIICKTSTSFKDSIYKNVYTNNLTFTSIKNFYTKYLGGVSFIDNILTDVKPVFNEELTYARKESYKDGVKLEVESNYLVPVLETGLVVYIGEKEGYGNVIIIQSMEGVDIWYGNMASTSVKLYDYIEKGDLLGEVSDNYLYLVYSRDGNYLDYEEYLK